MALSDRQHPKLLEICDYGTGTTEDQLLSHQVYMDLTELKSWWNVRVDACQSLQKVLVSGHRSRTADRQFFVPVQSRAQLSHADIQDWITTIGSQFDCSRESVYLALVDDNSSIIYYRATRGLCPPDPPEVVEVKHNKEKRVVQRRKQRLEAARKNVFRSNPS